MTNKELAEIMYPDTKWTIEELEKKYPERNLKEGAVVSRYAPSPTGFVHMGNMLSCFIENKLPKQTGGVFYLRIEDTDQKREVDCGIENIVNSIKTLGLDYNEGVISPTEQKGKYGPYIQSERKEIYKVYAKYLVENDYAYPCFCTEEEINDIRENQKHKKQRIGYYGKYAKCRFLSNEERAEKIKNGEPFTLRLKSTGDFENKVKFTDLVKGEVVFPENDQDVVLLKSDGIPVYHFAHAVDDHLMRTTHVLRGEDWLSSVPIHIELFNKLGFKLPKYAHLGLIMIVDENGTKRKISKRKDKDFTVMNYNKLGFPELALQEYLLTIANTNYEDWKLGHPDKGLDDFELTFSKIGSSPLFDYNKLVNISKNYISKMKAADVYTDLINWSKKYDEELYNVISNYKEYTTNILNIEREQKKPRKDYACFSEVKNSIWYMYDEFFKNRELSYDWQNVNNKESIYEIISKYFNDYYDEKDDKDTWFSKIVKLSEDFGYAGNMKDYKETPEKYKGNVTDIATVIRVAMTTKSTTPDLYEILKLLGKDKINYRVNILK